MNCCTRKLQWSVLFDIADSKQKLAKNCISRSIAISSDNRRARSFRKGLWDTTRIGAAIVLLIPEAQIYFIDRSLTIHTSVLHCIA